LSVNSERQPTQFAEYEFLLRVLHIVLKYKYRILLFSIVFTAVVVGISLLQPNKFSATSVVAMNLNENRGGVAPGGYRGNSTLSVLEFDMIVEPASVDERDRHLTRLKSFNFLSSVIDEFELLPVIFADNWDAELQDWHEDKTTTMQEAVDAFRGEYLAVGKHGSTDMITIGVTSIDPKLSQTVANAIPGLYNQYNLGREVEELSSRRAYLEKRLSEVRSRESQQSIYRLLESQLAVESLLYARSNYPLEVIIPAGMPRFKSSPKRKLWAIGGFVGSVFLAIFVVLGSSVFTAFRRDLESFSSTVDSNTGTREVAPNISGVGEEWVDKS